MRILVVEDNLTLAEGLSAVLKGNGYAVDSVHDGVSAEAALRTQTYDLAVLDLNLPEMDGLELLRRLRARQGNTAVLILTARGAFEDRVKGLDLGADDYLPKPFSLEELLAKLRALLRRQSVNKQPVFERNGIRLDLLGHTVHLDGAEIDLTSREYALLEVFMQNAGRVLTRTLISEKIWASNNDVDTNLLDVYMSRLRTKLETSSGRQIFKTVRGIGYQLL